MSFRVARAIKALPFSQNASSKDCCKPTREPFGSICKVISMRMAIKKVWKLDKQTFLSPAVKEREKIRRNNGFLLYFFFILKEKKLWKYVKQLAIQTLMKPQRLLQQNRSVYQQHWGYLQFSHTRANKSLQHRCVLPQNDLSFSV